MANLWTWASIVGLSMTPNLILGPSAAVAVGIQAKIPAALLLPVVTAAGYLEGLAVAWLAGRSTNIAIVHRWIERLRTPRSIAIANRWGIWGGLSLGCALVGQEPILVARWLDVEMRRLWLPLALSNAIFAVLYYAVVQFGLDQVAKL